MTVRDVKGAACSVKKPTGLSPRSSSRIFRARRRLRARCFTASFSAAADDKKEAFKNPLYTACPAPNSRQKQT